LPRRQVVKAIDAAEQSLPAHARSRAASLDARADAGNGAALLSWRSDAGSGPLGRPPDDRSAGDAAGGFSTDYAAPLGAAAERLPSRDRDADQHGNAHSPGHSARRLGNLSAAGRGRDDHRADRSAADAVRLRHAVAATCNRGAGRKFGGRRRGSGQSVSLTGVVDGAGDRSADVD